LKILKRPKHPTLRLTNNRPRDPRDTPTPINLSPKEVPLKADNLLPNLNKHLHDRHIKDGDPIKDKFKDDDSTPKINIHVPPRTQPTGQQLKKRLPGLLKAGVSTNR